MGSSPTVSTIFSVDDRSQKRRFDLNEEIEMIKCQIRELSLDRENIEEKIQHIGKEVEEARTQWEQAESRDKRRMMLDVQLKSLQCKKAQLSEELGHLHHRMKSIIGKLSSLRNQNLSDQKEDRSRVRGKIARMSTRRKPTTRKIHARQPEWRSLFT